MSVLVLIPVAAASGAIGLLVAQWAYNNFWNISHSRYPKQTQHSSKEFVLAAGAVAFFIRGKSPLKVCLVHYTKNRDEWLLAKGRKDEGEDLAATAIRETLEETGYPCSLLAIPELPTRATIPSSVAGLAHQNDTPRIASNSTEPFCITIRPLKARNNVKLIFWYVA
ncbi:hypothetical protein CPB85DRAFT_1438887 [Mucidula mucida]|nr:hypothetical protein CPB85DRAFT_1438887 [Mucidula mucida]